MKLKVQAITKANVQSSAGFLLQSSHTPKPQNVVTAKLNLDRIDNVLKDVKGGKMSRKLISIRHAIHPSGRFKTGRKTPHDFDETMLTDLANIKNVVEATRSRLPELRTDIEAV